MSLKNLSLFSLGNNKKIDYVKNQHLSRDTNKKEIVDKQKSFFFLFEQKLMLIFNIRVSFLII